MSNTKSDNYTYTITIIDTSRYSNLSTDEKKIFEKIRNSMLETFPQSNGKWDDDTIVFAENISFILLPGLTTYINTLIDVKINDLKSEINTIENTISSLKNQIATTSATTSTSNTTTTSKTTV
jgi:hypothetical protein